MIETYLLEQLAAFADTGTLLGAAEKLHLTQPTLTRSMKKLEALTGVSLFARSKGKIALNDNGLLAADYARRILREEDDMLYQLRLKSRRASEISIGSVAPGPLIKLVPLLTNLYAGKTITSEINDEKDLTEGLLNGTYQLAVLSHMPERTDIYAAPCCTERLYYCFDNMDYPTSTDGVHFADLGGRSILVPEEIGVWGDVIRREIPDPHFLRLDNDTDVNEVVSRSSLPVFSSDIALSYGLDRPGRVPVPILDDSAEMQLYCCCLKAEKKQFSRLFQRLSGQLGNSR